MTKTESPLSILNHWLSVPENSYLGSSYGYPKIINSSYLKDCEVSEIIAKLKHDVSFFQIYKVTICTSDESLYYFKFTSGGKEFTAPLVKPVFNQG
jgi:hypothetical protein